MKTLTAVSDFPRMEGPPMGYHTWSNLTFAHWRVESAALAHLIPSGLEVDTFDGDAWLGLVAFHMSNVRPAWFPAVPFISSFPETNLRTYVKTPNGETAVWFLSLDAASWPVVKVARWRWHLPYYHARMSVARNSDSILYRSTRRGSATGTANLSAELGNVIRPRTGSESEGARFDSEVGELGRFLVDRYTLFADDGRGGLYRGVVRHSPYPLREAKLTELNESLSTAVGISLDGRDPDHVVFSDGVDVDIMPLERMQLKPPGYE